jgi:hypothetical protein
MRKKEEMLKRQGHPTSNHWKRWHALNECTSMAGNKRRKAASQALWAAQLQNTYIQFKRTQCDALSSTEVSNLEAALWNDAAYGWKIMSNLRIRVKHNFYNIVVNRRAKAEHIKGKSMYLTWYNDQNSAEKATFKFRYSNEARTGKQKVDDWLDCNQKLFNGTKQLKLVRVSESNSVSDKQ